MKTNIIVLGSTGMLGSMVFDYLNRNSAFSVIATDRNTFDAEAFVSGVKQKTELNADYIINCIGVIKPFCKDNDPVGAKRAIQVNALFPHLLSANAKSHGAKVIQIATDCVYSGAKGKYTEADSHDALDVYGKSKSLGEVFDKSILNIRCSIIGPEKKNRVSLLEWFFAQPAGSELNGFAHHRWNGVTTLQFAKLCETIITKELYRSLLEVSALHHFVPNSTVDKYELLNLFCEVWDKKHTVKRVDDIGPPVDRTIASKYNMLNAYYPSLQMKDALFELKNYC
jgi:dTDP-4-dehydrorhamnose reductase